MRKLWLIVALFVLASPFAFAAANQYVLIQNYPWSTNYPNEANMTQAVGSYTEYDFSVNAATVFDKTCCFVMVEGGDGSESAWENYLTTNSSTILSWVSNGGALLVQSAGWNYDVFSFAGVSFDNSACCFPSGTLTPAGISAFTKVSISPNQSGNYVAHDWLSGAGLTVFMTEDANGEPIVAGEKYGNGYIMFSGLTTSQWHYGGYGLTTDMIAYTAGQGDCPEPGTLVMFGSGILGLAGVLRRKLNL